MSTAHEGRAGGGHGGKLQGEAGRARVELPDELRGVPLA
eukprot:CAMPEP_0204545336 /NCGR_PEP_ID=MMETSP0661-20131031/21199_1 /ASSEMBLY_ACC=CAM_ASM_000606 /TAXON_ID=109239 /ORGANISM="Alexandrium margalefi, Strain AMGDE01CS-322" /LENGTH=38 /DNA_ID= /DNA_START= /DNA_END= /DNA_ORIENTATION=